MHQIMAAGLQTPELALDPSESKAIAEGIQNVAQHYPVAIDPKTMAWINLGIVCSSVYGPRMVAIGINKNKRQKQKQEDASKVVTMSHVN